MSKLLDRCRVAVAQLKKVLAQQESPPFVLEQVVQEAGFDDVAEAKRYADEYYRKLNDFYKKLGNLQNQQHWWAEITKQLPSGEVRILYPGKKTLGRLRALMRIIGLTKGYEVRFRNYKGQDYFYKDYLHPVEQDIYTSRYVVPVRPYTGKAKAFVELPKGIKEQLRDLPIDKSE